MDKLIFTEQKHLNKKRESAKQLALSVFFGFGLMLWLTDIFEMTMKLWNVPAGGLGSGLIYTWNQIGQVLGSKDYVLLDHLSGAATGNGLFLGLMLVAVIALVFCLIKSRKIWPVVLLLIVAVMPQLIFDLTVRKITVAVLVAGFLMVVSYIKWDGCGIGKNTVLICGVAFLMVAAVSGPVINKMVIKPKAVQTVNTTIEKAAERLYYGENPLKSGDLTQTKRDSSKEAALEITMEKPQSMYLRGFIGSQYMKNQWQPLPESSYYENRDMFYWLEQEGFNSLGQLGQANALTASSKNSKEASESSKVEIKVKNADKRYAYIPYEFSSGLSDEGKEWGGSFVTPYRGKRLGSYEYSTRENSVKKWTDTASGIFTKADSSDNNQDFQKYLESESHYNQLIYDKYTYLNEGDYLTLRQYIGKPGNQSKGHIEYKLAIRGIKNYLKNKFIYTKNLGNAASEDGALAHFLESKKGYDVQYATAATMMFRYYGIPARYVEGYLVTPEDVKGVKANETISLSRERAHAWVEIYIDGTGFVPVEVCPSYEGVMEEADMSIGISNNSLNRPFDNNKKKNKNNLTTEEPEEDNSFGNIPIGLILIILLLIILAVIVIRLLIKLVAALLEILRRNKLFKKGEPKLAVCSIFKYMEDRNLSISEQVRNLGNMAAYSPKAVGEEDRVTMLAALKAAKVDGRAEARAAAKAERKARATAKAGKKARAAAKAERKARAAAKAERGSKVNSKENRE